MSLAERIKKWWRRIPDDAAFSDLYDTDAPLASTDDVAYDADFFARGERGEPYQRFCKIASQTDCALVQGLLYAAGIPSHTDFSHYNALYGVSAGARTAVFPAYLSILCADYDAALEIVRDFMQKKTDTLRTRAFKQNGKAVAPSAWDVLDMLLVPSPISKKNELLGISVFPKERA